MSNRCRWEAEVNISKQLLHRGPDHCGGAQRILFKSNATKKLGQRINQKCKNSNMYNAMEWAAGSCKNWVKTDEESETEICSKNQISADLLLSVWQCVTLDTFCYSISPRPKDRQWSLAEGADSLFAAINFIAPHSPSCIAEWKWEFSSSSAIQRKVKF